MFTTFVPAEFKKFSPKGYIWQFNNLYDLIDKYNRDADIENPLFKIRRLLGGAQHFQPHEINSFGDIVGWTNKSYDFWKGAQYTAWHKVVKSKSVDAEKLNEVIDFLKLRVDQIQKIISIRTATDMLDAFYKAVSQKDSKFTLKIFVEDDGYKPGDKFTDNGDGYLETSYEVYKKSGRNRSTEKSYKRWRYTKEEFLFDIIKK